MSERENDKDDGIGYDREHIELETDEVTKRILEKFVVVDGKPKKITITQDRGNKDFMDLLKILLPLLVEKQKITSQDKQAERQYNLQVLALQSQFQLQISNMSQQFQIEMMKQQTAQQYVAVALQKLALTDKRLSQQFEVAFAALSERQQARLSKEARQDRRDAWHQFKEMIALVSNPTIDPAIRQSIAEALGKTEIPKLSSGKGE